MLKISSYDLGFLEMRALRLMEMGYTIERPVYVDWLAWFKFSAVLKPPCIEDDREYHTWQTSLQ